MVSASPPASRFLSWLPSVMAYHLELEDEINTSPEVTFDQCFVTVTGRLPEQELSLVLGFGDCQAYPPHLPRHTKKPLTLDHSKKSVFSFLNILSNYEKLGSPGHLQAHSVHAWVP